MDDAVADGGGHFAAGNHRAADFKHRRNQQRLRHGQRAGTYRSAERIGHVVAADVERHKHAEQSGQQEQGDMIVLRVTQPPKNEIADHAQQ